ncbi:MAG: PmoA family protein [Candidatus Bathyarchaeia archaeon]
MTEISLNVSVNRMCSLAPIQVELDFAKYLDSKEMKLFHPFHVRMVDKATGRVVPSQFSLYNEKNRFKGILSWILLNESQKEFKVEAPVRGYSSSCRFNEGVIIWDRGDEQLEISVNGERVTNYVFNKAYERPFLYPVIGPDGLSVTRSVPTLGDHPHHKGIWLALGDVSGEKGKPGIDFWTLGTLDDPKHGRVIHQRFTSLEQGLVFAKICEENVWKQNDGLEGVKKGITILNETRITTIWNVSPMRIIDIHTVMTPMVDEVILNADVEGKDTAKENGPLAIRVTDNMRGEAEGTIVNSEGGKTEKECWGRRARWVDYYGPVVKGGPVNGIAVMDHPSNVRHPPGWHVRDYGLFAVNPFYSKKPEWPDQGPIYLSKAKGEKLELRYRIYIHRGNEKEGKVEQKWQDWVNPPKINIV